MLLSSETEFNYDEQISSSNSPGPPAGSSGGYLNTIGETVSGFIKDLRRGSDSPGRNDSGRRNENERQNDSWDTRSPRYDLRDSLRDIAHSTLQTLDDGEYFPPGQDGPYDLEAKILWTDENTRYYGPDAGEGGEILESEFIKINKEGGDGGNGEERNKDGNTGAREEANDAGHLNETKQGEKESEKAAASKPCNDDNANSKDQTRVQTTVSPDPSKRTQTSIFIGEYSTLIGTRKVHLALAQNPDPSANKKIGVLNFASAKKPGGGFVNGSQAQEESIARASTLFPSLITDAASQFYIHHVEDPGNHYYTHAMVYSPGIVLIRDDNGEWRSPVEVDVLTSAAVNAGEIRRGLEREERLRKEREQMEYWRTRQDYWKKRGEERRRENEKAMAEKQRLRELKEKNKKEKEQIAKLKKERAKLQKEMVKEKKEKGTDKGKAKDSGSEKEEPSVEQEKTVTEVENENEKGEEVEVEKPEENQENTTDSPDSGLGNDSDSQLKGAEENTESKGALIQDDQPQPEVPPEVIQEPASSSTIVHPPSPPTQPPQAPDSNPSLTYALALENAEIQIKQTMYDRISRILHLFQLHHTPHLILGSFGTGVFQNRIDLIATIFADLLIRPGGKFKDVFQTVVFAILGKETVRVFAKVFLKFDKQAQRERTGTKCVFEDWDRSDGDVKEGNEEKALRLVRWEARRRKRNPPMHVIPDEAAYVASFDPAQVDAAFHPLSHDAAQASAVSYPTSSSAADASAYATSSNAAQASVASYLPSFDATQAGAIPYPTFFTAAQVDAAVQANPTAADYYGIPEDERMILTRGDEQVDFVAEATANDPITPNAMVVDDGKDIEMVETKSLPTRSCEAQNSRSNKKEDGDVEMQ